MVLFLSVSFSICISYSLLMFSFWRGWKKLNTNTQNQYLSFAFASLIIPYRNEEKQLHELLENLRRINYPKESMEIILVDDHSTDAGPELIQNFMREHPNLIKGYALDEASQGKKAALRYGAKNANGEILLLTDADCRFGENWLTSMMDPFKKPDIQMVQGPVLIDPAESIIGSIQQIEFLSLVMSAAGSAGLSHPVLASGANLAIRKETYQKAAGHLKDQINTGDDMFLLEYLKKKSPFGITFLKDQQAIVRTPAVGTFQQFWNQRKRWTSKSTNYQDFEIMGTALLVFFTNTILLLTFAYAFVHPSWILMPIGLLVFKTLSEWPLMEAGLKFYGLQKKRKWFFLVELVYPLYVFTISLAGVFGQFSWKNRKR